MQEIFRESMFSRRPMLGQLSIPVACYRKGHCTSEGIPLNPGPEWWGASPTKTAEQNEQIDRNSKIIWNALSTFPFPAPFAPGQGVSFFFSKLKPDLVNLASADFDLEEDDVRVWITIQILTHYDEWVHDIQEALKKLQQHRRSVALARTIAVAVGSLVMAFAAPVAFVALFAAIRTGMQAYTDLKNAKAARQALQEAQKAFAESDPEFAKEIEKAEAALKKAEEAAEAQVAQAEQATIQAQSGTLPEAPKPNTLLFVAGGLAVAGLITLAIMKS